MNLVQERKADEVQIDSIDVPQKKQRSKRGFQGDVDENTYEA
jgi:hypothetical protein